MKRTNWLVLRRLLPHKFDNHFEGQWAALWLLGVLLVLKLVMSVNSLWNTAAVASGADGFRLESYGADGARAVLMLFATTALGQLALTVIGLLALTRYRGMTPIVFLLLLSEHMARRLVVQGYAVERAAAGNVGYLMNLGLGALLVLGLCLSLWPRRASREADQR